MDAIDVADRYMAFHELLPSTESLADALCFGAQVMGYRELVNTPYRTLIPLAERYADKLNSMYGDAGSASSQPSAPPRSTSMTIEDYEAQRSAKLAGLGL